MTDPWDEDVCIWVFPEMAYTKFIKIYDHMHVAFPRIIPRIYYMYRSMNHWVFCRFSCIGIHNTMVPWMRFLGDVSVSVFVVPSLGSRHLGFADWFRSHLLGGWLLVFVGKQMMIQMRKFGAMSREQWKKTFKNKRCCLRLYRVLCYPVLWGLQYTMIKDPFFHNRYSGSGEITCTRLMLLYDGVFFMEFGSPGLGTSLFDR